MTLVVRLNNATSLAPTAPDPQTVVNDTPAANPAPEATGEQTASSDTVAASNIHGNVNDAAREFEVLEEPADAHETLISLMTFGVLMHSRTNDLHYLVMMKKEVERYAEASGLDIEVPDNEADHILNILFRGQDPWLREEANGEARRLKKYWPEVESAGLTGEALRRLSRQLRDPEFTHYCDARMRRQIVVEWCIRYQDRSSSSIEEMKKLLLKVWKSCQAQRQCIGPAKVDWAPYDGKMAHIVQKINNTSDPDCERNFYMEMLRTSIYKKEINLKALQAANSKTLLQNNFGIGPSRRLDDITQPLEDFSRLVDANEARVKGRELYVCGKYSGALPVHAAISCFQSSINLDKIFLRDLEQRAADSEAINEAEANEDAAAIGQESFAEMETEEEPAAVVGADESTYYNAATSMLTEDSDCASEGESYILTDDEEARAELEWLPESDEEMQCGDNSSDYSDNSDCSTTSSVEEMSE